MVATGSFPADVQYDFGPIVVNICSPYLVKDYIQQKTDARGDNKLVKTVTVTTLIRYHRLARNPWATKTACGDDTDCCRKKLNSIIDGSRPLRTCLEAHRIKPD